MDLLWIPDNFFKLKLEAALCLIVFLIYKVCLNLIEKNFRDDSLGVIYKKLSTNCLTSTGMTVENDF